MTAPFTVFRVMSGVTFAMWNGAERRVSVSSGPCARRSGRGYIFDLSWHSGGA